MKTHPEPDRAAMEIVHRKLCITTPIENMLATPALKAVLVAISRRHMRCRTRFDAKKQQANDIDQGIEP